MTDDVTETTCAYLFCNEAENLGAVALTPSGEGLPFGSWVLQTQFELAVQLPTPMGLDPEPILRGIKANGHFVWRIAQIIPFGTSQ